MLIFFKTPVYLRMLSYLATKLWDLWINKYENLHYWKIKNINSEKTVSQFTIKPLNKISKKLAHDTIQWLKCFVHYLNMKMR